MIALPLLLAAALGAGALAVYAYDRSQNDRIAAGIRVADVEIGGLTVKQARAKLKRVLLPRYGRPLVIATGQRRFVLRSDAARLRVDIAAALANARAISRHGGFLDRVSRELRGRHLAVELEPRVRYSPRAVTLFIERVGRAVRVRPRSARFLPSLTRPRLVPSQPGLALRTVRVRSWIEVQLPDPNSKRLLPLPTRVLKPKLTTVAAQRKYRYFIAVDRTTRHLRLFIGLKPTRSYVIAVGRVGLETPAGLY
jgi:Putative peptidoglycan binding domain